MQNLIKTIIRSFLDLLVIVTMLTTFGLVVGLLTYAGSTPSKTIIILCFLIGIIGTLAIIVQVYSIVHRKRLQQQISNFYVMGYNLTIGLYQPRDPEEVKAEVERWIMEVESFARERLGESNIAQIRSIPPTIIPVPGNLHPPLDSLYRLINNRLFWLDRFRTELARD